ncbi:GatB/YqeY domain-containing protein [Patescibacteria group bacterium]|nr:GatB/YqeY domain-containing protein [Patescibacteria group bacterium]
MLKDKIQSDLNQALKRGDEITCSTLRMLLAAILSKEKEKRYKISKEEPELTEKELAEKSNLTDEEVIEVISSEIKKRKEAILGFEKGERKELAEKEKAEMEVLEKYLPEQLSEQEIKRIAKEVIEKVGATEIKDMGRVMAEMMPQVRGKADGGLVSKVVKELLTTEET